MSFKLFACTFCLAVFGGGEAEVYHDSAPAAAVHRHRPGYWQPGGDEARVGSPYFYSGVHAPFAGRRPHARMQLPPMDWAVSTDPYTHHFGPGFYRHFEYGHHRFPYYSYRRPWYFPGPAVYNRDTNLAW